MLARAVATGKSTFRNHRSLVFVIVLGVVIRIAFIAAYSEINVTSDMAAYYYHGSSIFRGVGYVSLEKQVSGERTPIIDQPTAYRPVGYPVFVALVFFLSGEESLNAVKIAQVAIAAANIALIYLISRRLFSGNSLTAGVNTRAVAVISSFLFALHPNQIAYTATILSETLSLLGLLVCALLLLALKDGFRKAVLVGIAVALTAYVKPQFILIPVIYYGLRLPVLLRRPVRRQYLIAATLWIPVAAVIHLPWIVRNYATFGSFVWVSTNGGINLLIGNNPYANGRYYFGPEVTELYFDSRLNEAQLDNRASTAAISFIRQNPQRFASLIGPKLFHTFWDSYDGIAWVTLGMADQDRDRMRPITLLYTYYSQGYWRLLLCTFVISMLVIAWQAAKYRRFHMSPFGLGMIAFIAVTVIIYFGGERFRFPVDPWMIIYVAGALTIVREAAISLLGRRRHEYNEV